jgi:hypothetical protein
MDVTQIPSNRPSEDACTTLQGLHALDLVLHS